MKKKLMAMLLAAGAMLGERASATPQAEWESLMCANRPHLSAKETRSPRTLAARSLAKNGGQPLDEIASRTLGASYVRSSEWDRVFQSDEESIDVCALAMDGNAEGRFAVYSQIVGQAPYYWTVEGLEPAEGQTLAGFLEEHCLVGGEARISVAEGVLSADDVDICVDSMPVPAPYARFRFAFIDDAPGANWAHPCRCVFVSEDMSCFTVVYKEWFPSLSFKGTGEPLPLVWAGGVPQPQRESLDEAVARAYGYAKGLESNGVLYNTGDRSRSYFVLVSGGGSANANGIRFWCDTAMLYSTLTRKYGVDKNHIWVYVSDGNSTGKDANLGDDTSPVLVDSPRDLDGDGKEDVTGAASKSSLKTCMARLQNMLTANDQLFVFFTSHGGSDGVSGIGNYDCTISLFGSSLRDDELADMIRPFPCPVAVAVESCYSGGFVDDICAMDNRAVATACNHYEVSWGWGGGDAWRNGSPGNTHACNCWAAPLNAAFRGFWPKPSKSGGYPWEDDDEVYPDSNHDGFVSFAEAAAFAQENDKSSDEHPQYAATGGTGESFFILNRYEHKALEKTVLLDSYGKMNETCTLSGKGEPWKLSESAPSWIKTCSLVDAQGNVSELTSGAAVTVSGALSLLVSAEVNESSSTGRSCVLSICNGESGRIEYNVAVNQSEKPQVYEVVYNPGRFGSGEPLKAEKVEDVALTLQSAIFVRAGYSQTGWSAVDGGDKLYGLAAIYTDNASLTLYPYWTANKYTVRFDKQGGTGGTTSALVQFESAMPSIVKPQREGYVFEGYFSGTDGTGTMYYTEDGAGTRPWDIAYGTTLYAKWTPIVCAVTFDLQGGTGVSGVEASYGCLMPEIAVPVRVGYVFAGYFARKNGYGIRYYNADGTCVRAWNNTATTTLYASWKAASYDVTLDLQDGNGGMDSATAIYGNLMPDIVPPVRAGYEFLGYYSEPEGAGEMYYDKDGRGGRAWDSATGGTLYAHWMAFGFSCRETTVCEGSSAEIRVMGGDAATNSSVKVYLTYNTAAAADIDKFPLILSWAAGEIGEKVITIPIKTDKTLEADEYFTLQLAEAEGIPFIGSDVCTVTIHDPGYGELAEKIKDGTATKAETNTWTKVSHEGIPYIRGLAGPANAGKVTGSGYCPDKKKVTLKATANKGWVFVGWRQGTAAAEAMAVKSGNGFVAKTASLVIDRTAKPGKDTATSTTLTGVTEDTTYYANFITSDEDKAAVMLAVDGVEMRRVEDNAPYQTNICAGVCLEWPIAADALSQTTVKVSGLPSGLKFTAKDIVDSKTKQVTVPANTIYGAPTAASAIDKKTGLPKPSDVKITVTTAGKSSVTYLVKLTVDPLPNWAVGSFDGEVGNGESASAEATADKRGTVALTIAANGKISGKILESGKTWTLSAGQFNHVEHVEQVGGSDVFHATVIGKAGKEVVTNEVTVSAAEVELPGGSGLCGVVNGNPQPSSLFPLPSSLSWTAYQNLWKRADTKASQPVFKKNIVVEHCFGAEGDKNNTVKITFKKDGAVSFSGKIGGVSVSGSSQLTWNGKDWCFTFYVPPKKGFDGWCETLRVELTLDEQNVVTAVKLGEPMYL